MFHVSHLSHAFDARPVLTDVSFAVPPTERLMLVGDNGCGKSTLLRICAGLMAPDQGQVFLDGMTVGYLPQEHRDAPSVRALVPERIQDWQIAQLLARAHLEGVSLEQPARHLSGGERTRLALAAVLGSDPPPTLLLLDEPTNTLDAGGLEWLTAVCRDFEGAIICASHDRRFIDHSATSVLHLDRGGATVYPGTFSDFDRALAQRRRAAAEEYDRFRATEHQLRRRQITEREHATATSKKHRAPDNDKQLRDGKVGAAQRAVGKRLRAISSRLDQLEVIERPIRQQSYEVAFHGETHRTRLIVAVRDGIPGYAQPLTDPLSFTVCGQERLRLLGPNGSGKSTLLGAILGSIPLFSGEVKLGTGIRIGWLSQELDGIVPSVSALDQLMSTGFSRSESFREARRIGISPQEMTQPVKTLSRGQQAKLAITKLLFSKYDLLLLDEPTNHLDIGTRQRMEEALCRYRGAVIVASHDEQFVESVGVEQSITLRGAAPLAVPPRTG